MTDSSEYLCWVHPVSGRGMKVIENRALKDEEKMELQEIQLKEAKHIAQEAGRKYEEVACNWWSLKEIWNTQRSNLNWQSQAGCCWEMDEQIRPMEQNLKMNAAEGRYSQKEQQ